MKALHTIGRHGELRLTFTRRNDSTVLSEIYSRPPLQVMRAIRDNAGWLCVYLLSPTGGVVQEDRYTIQIVVGADTRALCTTQSATKVYRMPQGCAEQVIHIRVERGAVFEFIPDAAILFADADFRQQIVVTLQPGALLFMHEIVMPGRLARGERLQFRRYANRLMVQDDAGLVLYDNAELSPAQQDLNGIGRLEGYPCWGSAYLLGDLQAWDIDAAAFCRASQHLFECGDAVGGLSSLYRNGFAARMVSERLEAIYAAFHGLRSAVRTQLGLPNAPLRK